MKKECEKYGEIESIRILRKKNCAFVNFTQIKHATAALNGLQNKKLGDMPVKVNYGKVCRTENRKMTLIHTSSSPVPFRHSCQ